MKYQSVSSLNRFQETGDTIDLSDASLKLVVPLRKYGDPILRTKCAPVKDVKDVQIVVRALNDTLDWIIKANAWDEDPELYCGLAAPQIGFSVQVAVVHFIRERITLINPQVTPIGDAKFESSESCLSIPGFWGHPIREERIENKYLDSAGKQKEGLRKNIEAAIIQHETDHLNGILYCDRVEKPGKTGLNKLLIDDEKTVVP